MLLLGALTQKVNRWLGPFLLRKGIQLRYRLSGGVLRDSTPLDAVTFLPVAQRLISLEVHEEFRRLQGQGSWSLFGEKPAEIATAENQQDERVRILERYLRPALVPDEQWWNIRQWQFHSRLVKWARAELLQAKYDVRSARRKLLDGSSKLPSSGQIIGTLRMKDWAPTKQKSHGPMGRIAKRLGGELVVMRGGALAVAHVPDAEASVEDLTLEEILEVAGGFVEPCGPLNALCEQAGIYQLWSKEYVEYLGSYLRSRAEKHTDGDTIVVDVGAGDGILAQALRDFLEKDPGTTVREPGKKTTSEQPKAARVPTIVATDDHSWRIPNKAIVENLTVQEAMDKYAITANVEQKDQTIVICSWMPMGEDWSRIFREYRVDEYILIGEADDGQCGDNWSTWGNPTFHPEFVEADVDSALSTQDKLQSAEASQERIGQEPLFVDEGYERKDLERILPFQFSRFDCKISKSGTTVSFRRTRD